VRRLHFHNLNFCFWFFRSRKALGVTSHAKDPGKHYLLLDFDNLSAREEDEVSTAVRSRFRGSTIFKYSTKHGFHVLVFRAFTLTQAAIEMLYLPHHDKTFVANGYKRGYWFLETPRGIPKLLFREYGLKPMRISRVIH
jgi:hypothetical protein